MTKPFLFFFGILLAGTVLSAELPPTITFDSASKTYSGYGTITGSASSPLTISGDTTFQNSGGAGTSTDILSISAPVTGSGTIHHTFLANSNGKLAFFGTLSGFSGTISNEHSRWTELYATDSNTTLASGVAACDMKKVTLTSTNAVGFAPVAKCQGADSVTFQIGDIRSDGTAFEVLSSAFCTNPLRYQVGYLNQDSTFSGTFTQGSAAGVVTLEKVGSGTWTLTNTGHAYSGGTVVSSGTLLFSQGVLPKNGDIFIAKDAELVLNTSGDKNFTSTANHFTGTGTLVHTHSTARSKLRLGADFSGFSGTIEQRGTRWIELMDSIGDSSNVTLHAVRTPLGTDTAAEGFAFWGTADDDGQNYSTMQFKYLYGDCNTTVSSSSSNASKTIRLVVGSDDTTSVSDAANILSGRMVEANNVHMNLEKVGANTWTLTGSNTFAGWTKVSGGTLQVGNGGTAGSLASQTLTIGKNGTLTFNRSDDLNLGNRILTAEANTSVTWAKPVFDPRTDGGYVTANFVKKGAGKLTLNFDAATPTETYRCYFNGTNTGTNSGVVLNANVAIEGGTLNLTTARATGEIVIRGGLTGTGTLLHSQNDHKLVLFGNNQAFVGRIRNTSNRWVELFGATAASPNAVYELNGSQGIAFAANGDQTFTLGALVGSNASTRMIRSGYSSGTLTIQVGSASPLVPDSENVFAGCFGDASNAGYSQLNLEKIGAGTWTLSGTSFHSGQTTVSGGVLRLTGSLQKSNVTVAQGGGLTLEGAIGTAGSAKNLAINGDFLINFTDGSLQDLGTVSGNVTFGDTAQLTLLTDGLSPEDLRSASYELDAASVSFAAGDSWASLIADAVAGGRASDIWDYSQSGTKLFLFVDGAKVPEPAAWSLLLLGTFGLLFLKKVKGNFQK